MKVRLLLALVPLSLSADAPHQVFYGLAFLLSSFGIDAGLSQVFLNYVFSLPNSRKNETEGACTPGLRLLPSCAPAPTS